jgi:hypothetical protein
MNRLAAGVMCSKISGEAELGCLRVCVERTHRSGEEQCGFHNEGAEGIREMDFLLRIMMGFLWDGLRVKVCQLLHLLRDCVTCGCHVLARDSNRHHVVHFDGSTLRERERQTEDRTLILDGDSAILRELVHNEKHLVP